MFPEPEGNRGGRGGGRAAYDFFETTGIDDPQSILSRGGRAVRKKGKGGKGLTISLPNFSPIKAPKAKRLPKMRAPKRSHRRR
jgi:hypothetical protein